MRLLNEAGRAMVNFSQSHSLYRQLLRRVLRYATNLYNCWSGMVARIMHQFILSLQFSPAQPLFGHDDRADPSQHADYASLRRAVHGIIRDPAVVDMATIRSGTDERFIPPVTVLVDLPKYTARPTVRETDNDGK